MGTVKACEFANAYQKKIAPRGRTKERIAAEAAYSASVVETAHPNRRAGETYKSVNLKNAKQACICKLEAFLGRNDYSNNKCFGIIRKIREIYHGNGISNYTYGNAQKWVTIAIKYYIVLCSIDSSKHIDISNAIYERFKDYKLFPVDQTIRRLLRRNYDIKFDYDWYACDNLDEFKKLWKDVGVKINQPLWDWELDAFQPSERAKNLPQIYN